MNTYEFTFLSEGVAQANRLEEIFESYKGKKLSEKSHGKRLLAYPINNIDSAEYHTWIIQMDKDKVNDFKQKLKFENVPLRYLMLTTDEPEK